MCQDELDAASKAKHDLIDAARCAHFVRRGLCEYTHIYIIYSRICKIWFKCSLQAWNLACLQRIHSWGGHVARYEAYDPYRWTSILTHYRDSEYINIRRAQSSDGRHLNRGHARPVWRWEQHFCLYYKRSQPNFGHPTWRSKASDEDAWSKSGLKWAQLRLDRSLRSKGTW